MSGVWQPNKTQWRKAQWRLIWIVTIVMIFSWPPEHGRSLAVIVGNWVADPGNSLVTMPAPLPMGLGDDGDAVTAHDMQESEYYRQYESSAWIRLRMKLKSAADPFDTATQRQVLVGIAILSVLVIWRLKP